VSPNVTRKSVKKRPRGRPRKHADNAAKCRAYRMRLKRSVHFRSDTHLWSTPQAFFDALDVDGNQSCEIGPIL
jgi:hypothetical protein